MFVTKQRLDIRPGEGGAPQLRIQGGGGYNPPPSKFYTNIFIINTNHVLQILIYTMILILNNNFLK